MSILKDTIIHGILNITKQIRMGSHMRNAVKVEDETMSVGDKEAKTKIYGADIGFIGDHTVQLVGKKARISTDALILDGLKMYGTKDPGDIDWGTTDIPDGTIYFKLKD